MEASQARDVQAMTQDGRDLIKLTATIEGLICSQASTAGGHDTHLAVSSASSADSKEAEGCSVSVRVP